MARIGEHYQIVEKLGQGGMGDVYRGLDVLTQTPVAIKNLRGSISTDAEILERFRREGAALRELNHPNIVKMLDMIQHEGENYLIMEYIDGGDLAGLLKERGKLPVNGAVRLALELADALSRAHHLGIIHRDIKPANVLIASNGTPRLTDFGVARIETEERLTGTGVAVGTLDYMPPEAVNGEPVDVRGDIWAFGVMLYEMLTGARPFTGDTTLTLLTNILTLPAPDLILHCPDAPPDLCELIEQMLQKDPKARLRSARQVGAALEAILRGEPVNLQRLDTPSRAITAEAISPDAPTDVHDARLSAAPSSPKRRLPIRLMGAAVLILIIGGAALAMSGVLSPKAAAPTPTSAETSVPTTVAALNPIAADEPAAEGYRWVSVDEARLLMPVGWTYLDMTTLMNTVRDSLVGEADMGRLAAGITYWQQQRASATYINWLNIQGAAVFIEDTGLMLNDEMQDSRVRELVEQSDFEIVGEIENIQLPAGTARRYILQGEINNLRMQMVVQFFQKNASTYVIFFSARADRADALQPIIDTVLPSFHIVGDGNAPLLEGTAEAAVSVGVPDGWKLAQGDGFSLAVPADWLAMRGSWDLVTSTVELLIDTDYAQRLIELTEQFPVQMAFGAGSREAPVIGAVLSAQSAELSLDFLDAYMQAIMEETGSELTSSESLVLPGGPARRLHFVLPAMNQNPAYHSVMTIIQTPQDFYMLSLSTPALQYETLASTFDQIAETFSTAP